MASTTKAPKYEQIPMLNRWMDDGVGQPTTTAPPESEPDPIYTCTQCDEQTNGNSQLCLYCKNATVKTFFP